jgi:hypothetical protein
MMIGGVRGPSTLRRRQFQFSARHGAGCRSPKSGSHLTPRWRDRDSNPRSPVECNIFRDCPVRAFRARPSVREEGSSARVQGLESRFPPPSEVSRAIPQRSRTPCQEPLARRRSCRRASRRCRAQFFACPCAVAGVGLGYPGFGYCGVGAAVASCVCTASAAISNLPSSSVMRSLAWA